MSYNREVTLGRITDNINFMNKYNVNSVLIFGSLNRGEFSEDSDVDIAIIGENKIELDNILEMELYFEKLLKREIDVIDLQSDTLDLFVKINILNEGCVVYSIDDNKKLQSFKEEVDWIYKENENFIFFRKRDVLGE